MKFIVLLFILYTGEFASACTTFLIERNGHFAFGRNYDWITDLGMICTNPRGLYKSSVPFDGKTISWMSKYGSITFNQYGKEFPMGGMNENGLIVEVMWLDGSQYPSADDRAGLNVLQWIQYQLDNCSNIDEVLATDKKIRISPGNPPLHFLVADAKGHAATIEFIKGELIVHKGANLKMPVLTNTDYASLSRTRNSDTVESKGAAGGYNDNSVKRFADACDMLQLYKTEAKDKSVVDYSFDILEQVKVPDFTKWSIVYDITNKTVYFKTARYTSVKSIALSDLSFDCKAPSLSFDVNQDTKGNIIGYLKPFTIQDNLVMVKQAALESKANFEIPEAAVTNMAMYAASVQCKNE